jgi:hypothetical protein
MLHRGIRVQIINFIVKMAFQSKFDMIQYSQLGREKKSSHSEPRPTKSNYLLRRTKSW